MPVILIESGFMDNLEEAKTMLDPEFQKADAEATCRGIASSSVLHMFQKKKKRMLYIVSKSEHITIRTMPIKREKG